MSFTVEDPVKTLIRLLRTYLRVVKEDGGLASIHISDEWYNSEISKTYDGQITVGLENCREERLSINGAIRRSIVTYRVNVWVLDKPEKSLESSEMRNKILQEVKNVIREKGEAPYKFEYSLVGASQKSGSHKVFYAFSDQEIPPTSSEWNELSDEEYAKLWYSDDERLSETIQENGKYPLLLFKFKLDAETTVLKSLTLKFEGYGESPAGNGVTIKAWNFSDGNWQKTQTSSGSLDETISIEILSGFENFVDKDGYVYLLAKTANPSDGVNSAVLHCDYAEMDFSVNGISYCKLVSYRNLDETHNRPFIWRTELSVEGWIFERTV